ncbi:MAG: alpha/beta hydrolase [Deltaproteobacteria bacterium]|nr:alpha/beta hydrolase [Deltaproteobacteria bacterium]
MLKLDQSFSHQGSSVAWGKMGKGYPLVLIHGTPFNSQVWRNIAPLLADHWEIFFFDLIGYGQSEMRPGQNVSLGVQNGLLAALLDHWKIDRPDVLCHDFGGATALRAYHLDGLRYRKLTMVDPVAVAPWGSPFVSHVRKFEEAFAGLPEYAHEALLRAYILGAANKPLHEQTLQTYMKPWMGDIGKAAFYRQIAQMDQRFTDEVEPLYGPMEGEVTLLWGEMDAWIPLERGEKLAARITNGNLVRVPNAGHLVQEDAPEAIVAAMLSGLLRR